MTQLVQNLISTKHENMNIDLFILCIEHENKTDRILKIFFFTSSNPNLGVIPKKSRSIDFY